MDSSEAAIDDVSPAQQVKDRLVELLSAIHDDAPQSGSDGAATTAPREIALSGALSRALCYAHRHGREAAAGNVIGLTCSQ